MKFKKSKYDSFFFNRNVWSLNLKKAPNKIQKNKIKNIIIEQKIEIIFCVASINYSLQEYLTEMKFKQVGARTVLSIYLKEYKNTQSKTNDIKIVSKPVEISSNDIALFAKLLKKTSRLNKDPLIKKEAQKYYVNWIENSIKNIKNLKYFAFYKNKIAGLLIIRFDNKIPRIELLAVSPVYQKLGVGSALINHSLEKLKTDQTTTCLVGTQVDNINAIRFYEKNNFRTIKSEFIYHLHLKT